jgi:hypothetical protein
MTIWKSTLQFTDEQVIELPESYEILCIQTQFGRPCLWAKVNPKCYHVKLRLRTFGTGQEISEGLNLRYIGTYQINNGSLAFHVFEEIEK